ncbi:hypothetical protein GLAREA_04327 [Glarea lozoyensis ATCC 20868]|uniref:Uncharacterized protein n=1 Tax=Glarea lozoyensis (strain ATCC 20868 / MF5171) TaxID=1116229 RepID=S3D632_GLAL2|nr:uncharacterized protein GLAREA_04327 [Glarea lozoyensis ATCC 20868]EPE27536.1 hypothetical protein GLAREA_04327 [Glarea lozoyensis ATCC 20868]
MERFQPLRRRRRTTRQAKDYIKVALRNRNRLFKTAIRPRALPKTTTLRVTNRSLPPLESTRASLPLHLKQLPQPSISPSPSITGHGTRKSPRLAESPVQLILNTPPTPRRNTIYQKDITLTPDIAKSKSIRMANARNKLRRIEGHMFREEEMDEEVWLGGNLWFRVEDEGLEGPDFNVQDAFQENPEACMKVLDYLLDDPGDGFWKGEKLRTPRFNVAWEKRNVRISRVVQRVNLLLLRCCCKLKGLKKGSEYSPESVGLGDAMIALCVAESAEVGYMVCKCRVYIGLCFQRLGRWEDAVRSWEMAELVGVLGWEGRMRYLMRSVRRESKGLRPLRVLGRGVRLG